MRIVHAQPVGASPQDIYGLIADPHRRPEWLVELRRVEAPPGPVAEGEVFTGWSQAFLHRVSGLAHVLEADGRAHLQEHVVVGVGLRTTWDLETNASGSTQVTATLDIDVPGGVLSWPERWLLRWRLGRMQQRSLRALAQLATR